MQIHDLRPNDYRGPGGYDHFSKDNPDQLQVAVISMGGEIAVVATVSYLDEAHEAIDLLERRTSENPSAQ